MNIYQKACFAVALIGHFFTQQNLFAATLNGTASFVYKNVHHVFSNNEIAQGFVRMGGGFTIKPGAIATLDTVISVSGAIDLRETGILQLVKNLNLDTGLSWSSGGYINGRGNAILLNGPLSIPASKTIHIIGDTIIDGKGGSLTFDQHSQILVESNATLTLQNLSIKSVRNNRFNPCIKVLGSLSKLALKNVTWNFTDDVVFSQGELFIHNDVTFAGTSSFIFTSVSPCHITPHGKLLFDIKTTFSFAPATTKEGLLNFQSKTSQLILNGSSLKTTNSGMQLTRGTFILNNKVNLTSKTDVRASQETLLTSRDYGSHARYLSWHPSGTILAAAGFTPTNGGTTGFANTNKLRLYSFDGTTLIPLTSIDFSGSGSSADSLAWSPTGTFLSVGPDFNGGSENLITFGFDGSNLTLLNSVILESVGLFHGMAWHPGGNIIAIGGNFSAGGKLQVYSFDGTSMTSVTSLAYGGSVTSCAWNNTGTVLAVGGTGPTSGNELQIHSFDGSGLSLLDEKDYGSDIYALDWNPDGTVLAVGGQTPTDGNELKIYRFNGSTLNLILSQDYGGRLWTLRWDPTGRFLALGGTGSTSGQDLQLYYFDGTSLSLISSRNYGNQIASLRWHPSGAFIAVGGQSPSNGDEIQVDVVSFVNEPNPQTFSRSIVFGNSALGSDYDLNVEVLGNAHVIVDGKVMDDSA